ncbi:SDR family oxidoreductase [Oceanobacillus oncorhynchi subsp. oncorhynchi]|uniref:SDR family NAD(P)-dependent oxidoreductase n=1 Tax=Oceanobacillus oncorhynchi TaxID=545501 RepID=UPI0031D308A0
MFDITGKHAIITGGAQGLGKAMVKGFHQAGVELAVIDISDEVFNLPELEVNDCKIHPIKGDLLDFDSIEKIFNEALEKLNGRVDILINSAGLIKRMPAKEFDIEVWNRIMSLNVLSVFELSKHAALKMKEQQAGKIINFGSIVSVIGAYHSSAYSASKGGVVQLTKSLSNEWAQYGIQVNAIAPGYMETTMNSDLKGDPVRKKQVDERIPAKRWGTPEDVCGVALFLSSPASDYVSGTLLPVDGGVLGR